MIGQQSLQKIHFAPLRFFLSKNLFIEREIFLGGKKFSSFNMHKHNSRFFQKRIFFLKRHKASNNFLSFSLRFESSIEFRWIYLQIRHFLLSFQIWWREVFPLKLWKFLFGISCFFSSIFTSIWILNRISLNWPWKSAFSPVILNRIQWIFLAKIVKFSPNLSIFVSPMSLFFSDFNRQSNFLQFTIFSCHFIPDWGKFFL